MNAKGQDGNVGDKTRGKVNKPSVRIPSASAGKMDVGEDRNANMNGTRDKITTKHGAFAK